MDCNKEEAFRAKAIAEKKMEAKDFVAAKKVAQKAQQLYPELENISQMIVVCDVHISSQKVYGNEKDWYGILQLEMTADELSIKKQYRKLALLLHPDKSKFAGSSDAFKLVGEAQRILLDKEKRMLHDSKRKTTGRSSASNWVAKPPNRHPNQATFTPVNIQAGTQRAQTGVNEKRVTFWTACPYCSTKYEFRIELINRLTSCQSCKKTFTGYEINAHGVSATKWAPPHVPVNNVPQGAPVNHTSKAGVGGKTDGGNTKNSSAKPQVPVNNVSLGASLNHTSKAGVRGKTNGGNAKNLSTKPQVPVHNVPQGASLNHTSKVGVGGKTDGGNTKNSSTKKQFNSGEGEGSKPREWQPKEQKLHGNVNGRRRKQVEESSESYDSESSELEDDEVTGDQIPQDFQYFGEQPRRSSRSKRNVSYSEKNLNDDDTDADDDGGARPSKRAKQEVEDQSHNKVKSPGDGELKQEKQHYTNGAQNGEREAKKEYQDKTPEKESEDEPELYELPDPDFSDFDSDKRKEFFAAGQMWALYDTQGGMPRFYACIRKVSPGFKLQISWLEPDPDDENDLNWVNADFPVACGKFKRGNNDKAEELPIFSHLVSWEKGSEKETFKIYPRKGQTWALYKNWESLRKWSTADPGDVSDEKIKYEYEFVEILTDFDDKVGISVAYLVKVKGFACLFRRRTEVNGGRSVSSFTITPKELYRFSHMVPSFQMTGQESEDVPKGSFELDPAAVPQNVEEF